jgi:hypothetical protein
MPIAINGSGTVTGISVGGLPDGIVDADMLASNSVQTGKIVDDAVTDAKQNLSGAAKAWIRYDGTGTPSITDSFNISSVTEIDDGQNTIAFTTSFANASYVGIPTASTGDNAMFTLMHTDFIATGSCRIISRENRTTNRVGVVYTACAFFGDQ